jgi:F-box-like
VVAAILFAPLLHCRRTQSCRACLVISWDLRAGRQPLEMAQQHPVQALEQRDVVDAVFSKLDGVTLARSSCVCKLWNEAARLDRLWQTAYESAAQDAFQRNTELQLPALLQGLYLLQRHQHAASDVNTVSWSHLGTLHMAVNPPKRRSRNSGHQYADKCDQPAISIPSVSVLQLLAAGGACTWHIVALR